MLSDVKYTDVCLINVKKQHENLYGLEIMLIFAHEMSNIDHKETEVKQIKTNTVMKISRNENQEIHKTLFESMENYNAWASDLKEFTTDEKVREKTSGRIPATFLGTNTLHVDDAVEGEFLDWIESKGIVM